MIRFATEKDIPKIGDLLCQVDLVHHHGRPDIFKVGRKYSDAELVELLKDPTRPILVATDEADTVQGYCFCIIEESAGDNVIVDHKTLYIDDLCVDETCRGQHIGRSLYEYAVRYARGIGCYNVTLNVWECNPDARAFYDSLGMRPMKTYMEVIL